MGFSPEWMKNDVGAAYLIYCQHISLMSERIGLLAQLFLALNLFLATGKIKLLL
jgi:hypothetical protein